MKFLKLTQSSVIEIAIPINSDTVPLGPLSEKDAEDLRKDQEEQMRVLTESAGGKLVSVDVVAEVVEV
jgi:hypothetical protein